MNSLRSKWRLPSDLLGFGCQENSFTLYYLLILQLKHTKNKGKERRRLLPSFPPFLSKLFVFYAHLWSNFLSTVLFRIESSRAAKEATWWFNDGHTKPVAFSFFFFFQKRNRLKAQRGTDIKETNCDVYKAGLKAIENEQKKKLDLPSANNSIATVSGGSRTNWILWWVRCTGDFFFSFPRPHNLSMNDGSH